MKFDEQALKLIQLWNKREYKNEGQRVASLQILIVRELERVNNAAIDECVKVVNENTYPDRMIDMEADVLTNEIKELKE